MKQDDSAKDAIKDGLKDTMKKILLTGVGTIFMTEETIRSYLGEFKLPKELWAGFLENAAKTKQEFLVTFAKEAAQVLKNVDVGQELHKFFENKKMKVSVEVSFPKEDSDKKSEA